MRNKRDDVVDEMCLMYCKTESSYMEEISLSLHRKKKFFALLYEFQALMMVNTAWIFMVCGLMWKQKKKKKKSSRIQVYKGQKDSVGNACQAVGNTGFLSITD